MGPRKIKIPADLVWMLLLLLVLLLLLRLLLLLPQSLLQEYCSSSRKCYRNTRSHYTSTTRVLHRATEVRGSAAAVLESL